MRAVWLCLLLCVVVSGSALANEHCAARKQRMPISIKVNVEKPAPYILQDKSFKEINEEGLARKKSWLEEHGLSEIWSTDDMHTLGYAMGGTSSVFTTEYVAVPYDDWGTYYCPIFKTLEINIIYRTLIRIPKEIHKDSCAYSVILAHELKHHKANEDQFSLYMDKLQADLPQMIALYEGRPVARAFVQTQFDSMKSAVQEALAIYMDDFAFKKARAINAQIDSPESYAEEDKRLYACKER